MAHYISMFFANHFTIDTHTLSNCALFNIWEYLHFFIFSKILSFLKIQFSIIIPQEMKRKAGNDSNKHEFYKHYKIEKKTAYCY